MDPLKAWTRLLVVSDRKRESQDTKRDKLRPLCAVQRFLDVVKEKMRSLVLAADHHRSTCRAECLASEISTLFMVTLTQP